MRSARLVTVAGFEASLSTTGTPVDDRRSLLRDYNLPGDGFIDTAAADSEHDPSRARNDRHVAAGR